MRIGALLRIQIKVSDGILLIGIPFMNLFIRSSCLRAFVDLRIDPNSINFLLGWSALPFGDLQIVGGKIVVA